MQNRITALGLTAIVFSALLVPLPALAAAPLHTGCFMYHDGSGAEVALDQFVGQGIDAPLVDFEVTIDGVTSGVTFARTYSSFIVLSFAQNVTNPSSVVSLEHLRTSSTLKNAGNEFLGAFSCSVPTHLGPTVQSAQTSADGLEILIAASSTVDATDFRLTDSTSWPVSVGSGSRNVTAVNVSGSQIRLTLATPVLHTDAVSVRYFGGPPQTSQMGATPPFWSSMTGFNVTNIVPAPQQAAPVVTPPVITTPPPVLAPETPEATTEVPQEPRFWAKRNGNTAKLYAKNIIGAGKVQFMVNGREVAWVSALDGSDPKLRLANNSHYLVRTVNLGPGKNVLEIYLDGERVRRVSYTR